MNLEKQNLPCTVDVAGRAWRVKTDFRYGLLFYRFIKERKPLGEYALFFEGDSPDMSGEAGSALVAFYADKPPLPRGSAGDDGEVLSDWWQDGDLIYAAFMESYGIDLFDVRLHWHKFLALFRGLHDTKLNEVIGIRSWKAGDKTKPDAHMRRLKAAWRIEPEDTRERDPAYQKFMAKLAKGKKQS